MTTLTEKFTNLEEQLATQAITMGGYVDTVEAKLQALFDALDVITVNNAANTRALLAALGSISPCAPCPTPPLVVPPTGTDPTPVSDELCKRVQAFLHAMTEVLTVLDTISAFSVPFNPTLITDAISQVITSLANGDETPLPSFPEAVQIGGAGINYAAGNLLVGGTLVGYFTPLVLDLRDAMYNGGSANGAQGAYNTIINGAGLPSYVSELLIAAGYNELFTYYFDEASDPNLTGYSGSVCLAAPGSCWTLVAVPWTRDEGGSSGWGIVDPFGTFTQSNPVGSASGSFNFTPAIFAQGNLEGWTMEVLSGSAYVNYKAGNIDSTFAFFSQGPFVPADGIQTVVGTGTFAILGSAAFTVRMCSPEE